MSIYSYNVFITVAEEMSFVKASEIFCVSPSAISHCITKLEQDFGFPLFIRNKHKVMLTRDGNRILKLVKEVIASSNRLDQEVAQLKGLTAGIVHIGAINSVTVNWLPEIIPKFKENFPDIDIHVMQYGYSELLNYVTCGKVDFAIVSYAAFLAYNSSMQFIPLHNDRLVCVCPTQFQPQNKDFVTIDEVHNMKLILPYEDNGIDVVTSLKKSNIDANSEFTIFDDSSLITMVKCGFGYCVMPELSLAGLPTDGVNIYPILPYECRLLGIVAADSRFISPATQKMINTFMDFVHEKQLYNL